MELKFKLGLIMLFACLLYSQESFGYDSVRVEKAKGKRVIIHEVEQGETLYSLSRRYGALVSEIVAFNDVVDNTISLGQILMIPLGKEKEKANRPKSNSGVDDDLEMESKPIKSASQPEKVIHTVQPKETLFAISRLYGMSVDEIKALNGMTSNDLSVGEMIYVKASEGSATKAVVQPVIVKEKPQNSSAPDGYTEYLVQTGDMLETIARKFSVRPDSIIIWNQLSNTYLAIGQRLLIKGAIDREAQKVEKKVEDTGYSKKSKMTDQSGFSKIYEEGIAKKIEDAVDTDKYLAMHRTLKVGSMVEIRNLMNNKKIFVRIVGKLPETGMNENVVVRLTPICFERLGVIDPKARVEISYYED